jgi:hypothetical protein
MLDQTDRGKKYTLMQFLDNLTNKYGQDTVKVAAQGTHKKKACNLEPGTSFSMLYYLVTAYFNESPLTGS